MALDHSTVDDIQRIGHQEDRLCELEEGVLVEKSIAWYFGLSLSWLFDQANRQARE